MMRNVLLVSLTAVVFVTAAAYGLLAASIPGRAGQARLPGMRAAAEVRSDQLGVPYISAADREDAFRTLGYWHARDRLFQMELMRRKAAGRLAELFGTPAVSTDRKQRVYQFSRTARQIVADLPDAQRRGLSAYAEGVNAYLQQTGVLPPEFLALRFRPEPWQAADSILVILAMFQTLNGQEQDERMVSVMQRAMPADLVSFLTPDTDLYATVLVGGDTPWRAGRSVPIAALVALPEAFVQFAQAGVDLENVVAGSNNWAVAGSKTADGRAIVANDMHLTLGVPNIWYRADLRYQDRQVYGVTLPGVPGVIVGANRHVAWGFTNVTADLLDLIALETDPEHPGAYRTPQGWRPFDSHNETIKVEGGSDIELTLQDTIWGPVSDQPLLGKPAAIKWTALERGGVDLGLIDLDAAQDVKQAMALINRAGGPPQNVVFADDKGHIGWTYMGRFPKRVGFDGLQVRSWADGTVSWQGFIPPEELPRLYDPQEGFIATANNRTLGSGYPYVIGHNWALGYRAYRIAELLGEDKPFTERDMLAIQLDSRSAALDFYRELGLRELQAVADIDPELREAQQALTVWDGYMRAESLGAAFVTEFRKQLAETVFARVVAAGQAYDPEFRYAWREMETPLRQLLSERPKGFLPAVYRDDWTRMIIAALRRTGQALRTQYPRREPSQLTWGETHRMDLRHPFSKTLPQLAEWLDMPSFDSGGCASVCVMVMGNGHGASERLALSPAHPDDALLQMPGGQSGHFLSAHYADQQAFWQDGRAVPLRGDTDGAVFQVLPD